MVMIQVFVCASEVRKFVSDLMNHKLVNFVCASEVRKFVSDPMNHKLVSLECNFYGGFANYFFTSIN